MRNCVPFDQAGDLLGFGHQVGHHVELEVALDPNQDGFPGRAEDVNGGFGDGGYSGRVEAKVDPTRFNVFDYFFGLTWRLL